MKLGDKVELVDGPHVEARKGHVATVSAIWALGGAELRWSDGKMLIVPEPAHLRVIEAK